MDDLPSDRVIWTRRGGRNKLRLLSPDPVISASSERVFSKRCRRSQTMPLDAAIVPKNVTATLFYQIRTDRKPERYVSEPPPGVVPFTGIDDPRDMLIEDGRGRESEFSLDRNGFQMVRAPT